MINDLPFHSIVRPFSFGEICWIQNSLIYIIWIGKASMPIRPFNKNPFEHAAGGQTLSCQTFLHPTCVSRSGICQDETWFCSFWRRQNLWKILLLLEMRKSWFQGETYPFFLVFEFLQSTARPFESDFSQVLIDIQLFLSFVASNRFSALQFFQVNIFRNWIWNIPRCAKAKNQSSITALWGLDNENSSHGNRFCHRPKISPLSLLPLSAERRLIRLLQKGFSASHTLYFLLLHFSWCRLPPAEVMYRIRLGPF